MKKQPRSKSRFGDIYHYTELKSTMHKAEELAEKGFGNGIVLADCQTGGYGRNGSRWVSPDNGNIYASFFEEIDCSPATDFLPQRAAVAVYDTLKQFVPKTLLSVKWPNDVLIDMKKASGVIAKSVRKENRCFRILGVGINIFNPVPEKFKNNWSAVGIRKYSSSADKKNLLPILIKNMDNLFNMSTGKIACRYVSLVSWMKNMNIEYTQDGKSFYRGKISGFNEDGSIIKITKDNELFEFSSVSVVSLW